MKGFGPKKGRGLSAFDISQSPIGTLTAPAMGRSDQPAQRAPQNSKPVNVDLPSHLFVPRGARSVDIRRAATIQAATPKISFLTFEAPIGGVTHFYAYSVYSDGTLADTQEFIPTVNQRRVFPYHGDPENNFKINLGLGPDLSNNNIIHCQLTLNPGEKLIWYVINQAAVDVAMGVRMLGYVDYTMKRNNETVGG